MLLLTLLSCTFGIPDPPLDTGETGDPSTSDALVLSVDEDVVTVVRAEWTPGADEAWVEYHVDDGPWLSAPAVEEGSAVLLGLRADTQVSARLVQVDGSGTTRSEAVTIETGSLPGGLPRPRIEAWEPDLAHPASYAMISATAGAQPLEPPYWVVIFDRQGEVVWYREVDDYMLVFYPSVARDGTHIWYDASDIFGFGWDTPHLVRTTLDGRWEHRVDVPDMGQAVSEGPGGSFFYEQRTWEAVALAQVDERSAITRIWDCTEWIADHGGESHLCYMNTASWSDRGAHGDGSAAGTVLTSMFYSDTVIEIDVATGQPVRQMGQLEFGDPYTIAPVEAMFSFQHWPNWTDAGTLLVSTHVPGTWGVQIAAEFEVDDDAKTLTRIWSYESTDRWATQLGEAIRLDNGNTIQGYGQDGAVREVTPEGETAWEVSWTDAVHGPRVVGHLSLIDDLYALNVGPD